MKILVDRDSEQILGASFLALSGDEVIHCIIDAMYARTVQCHAARNARSPNRIGSHPEDAG